jgi:hypothetical protein
MARRDAALAAYPGVSPTLERGILSERDDTLPA